MTPSSPQAVDLTQEPRVYYATDPDPEKAGQGLANTPFLQQALGTGSVRHWMMSPAEQSAFVLLLQQLRPEVAIEIGTRFGGSLQVLSKFCGHVYSLDMDAEIPKQLRGRFNNVEYLTGPSNQTLPPLIERIRISGEKLGFVLVDGDHSAEGVKRDIEQLLRYGPVVPLFIIMHDSFNPECRRGLRMADWAANPFVHVVDLDFVPGSIIPSPQFRGQLWGGLALAYLNPRPRQGHFEIMAGGELTFQAALASTSQLWLKRRLRGALRTSRRWLEMNKRVLSAPVAAVADVHRWSGRCDKMGAMRVCFVCNEYPPSPHGGIGTCTQILARALVRAGHQVRVVGMYSGTPSASDYQEDEGVAVWRLRVPTGRLGWLRARYRLYHFVADWVRRGLVDLVEVPDWEGWAAGWRRLRVPVIVRAQGAVAFFAAQLGRPVGRSTFYLERAGMRRADFWCGVTRFAADKTREVFGLRSAAHAILYNPVETFDGPAAASRSRNQVVFTGTLTEKKGVVSLIKAWPRVLLSNPEAELHVFGKDGRSGDGTSMQSHLLSQLNPQQAATVRFHGHVTRDKLFMALRKARVAVFPSYAETFGIAPFEAMTCGCPTIYSRREPGPELIRHDQDALLIDPDQSAEIATAIVRVMDDDALACRLGRAGKERVNKTFSIETILPQNEAFFSDCISTFQARRIHTGASCSSP